MQKNVFLMTQLVLFHSPSMGPPWAKVRKWNDVNNTISLERFLYHVAVTPVPEGVSVNMRGPEEFVP